MVTVICHIYEDVDNLLPHFLKHYTNWGVDHFTFGVYRGTDNPAWKRALELGAGYSMNLISSGGEQLDVNLEGDFKTQVRNTLSASDWYIPTDLDEFHQVKEYGNVHELAKAVDAEGAEWVHSTFIDRIREDGSVPLTIDPAVPIWDQFPHDCRISNTIIKAWCGKVCLAKPYVECVSGHHAPMWGHTFKKFSISGKTFHFKWFGPLYEKEKRKYEVYTAQKREWAKEQTLLLDWLDTHGGKLI
jgi:hypothetical protein